MQEDNMSQLINTFKTMLNNSSNTSDTEDINTSSSATNASANDDSSKQNGGNNFNISPEMISNMANMLKNSNLSNNANQTNVDSNSNVKFNINENSNSNINDNSNRIQFNNDSQNSGNNPSIDFETIMKVKSIMDTLNKKDDPRSNLLYSLKPYLRKTRQDKLDQYVNLMKITQVTDLFNFKKGDKK